MWLSAVCLSGQTAGGIRSIYNSTNQIDNVALTNAITELKTTALESIDNLATHIREQVDEWERKGPYQSAIFLINAGYTLSDISKSESDRQQLIARDCFWKILGISDEIPAKLEYATLDFLRRDMSYDLLDKSKWNEIRELKSAWWLHCWQRMGSEADTIDGEHPRPDLFDLPTKLLAPGAGLAGVSPKSLPDGPAKDAYVRDLTALEGLHAERERITANINAFEEAKWSAEDFFVRSYAWPPYETKSLIDRLQSTLGDNHPAVLRIAHKLTERLPPGPKQELEAIISKLPSAGTPAEIRAARKLSLQQRPLPPIFTRPDGTFSTALERKGRRPKAGQLARHEAAAAPSDTQGGQGVIIAVNSTTEVLPGIVWYGLGATAFALIAVVLWRAQARGPSRPR